MVQVGPGGRERAKCSLAGYWGCQGVPSAGRDTCCRSRRAGKVLPGAPNSEHPPSTPWALQGRWQASQACSNLFSTVAQTPKDVALPSGRCYFRNTTSLIYFFFCLHLHPYLLSVTFAFISLPPPPSESCTCVEWSLALAHWRPSLTRWLCTSLWGCPGLTSPRWARDLNFCNSSLLRGSGATAWQAWAERAKSPPWACHAGRTLNTFI